MTATQITDAGDLDTWDRDRLYVEYEGEMPEVSYDDDWLVEMEPREAIFEHFLKDISEEDKEEFWEYDG